MAVWSEKKKKEVTIDEGRHKIPPGVCTPVKVVERSGSGEAGFVNSSRRCTTQHKNDKIYTNIDKKDRKDHSKEYI